MKRKFLSYSANKMCYVICVLIILLLNTARSNAQFFVEGGIGLDYSKGDSHSNVVYDHSSSMFNFSPQVGYNLNDIIAVGIRVTLLHENTKSIATDRDNPEFQNLETKSFCWRFSAFSRYKLWGIDKFSLLLDGSLYYEKNSRKEAIENEISFSKSTSLDSQVGIRVFPAVSYNLNEKFSIISGCNFFSMEFYSTKGKYIRTDNRDSKGRTNHFIFGVNSNIISSLSNIQIGFIYNF